VKHEKMYLVIGSLTTTPTSEKNYLPKIWVLGIPNCCAGYGIPPYSYGR
jgi:hypothetical protein